MDAKSSSAAASSAAASSATATAAASAAALGTAAASAAALGTLVLAASLAGVGRALQSESTSAIRCEGSVTFSCGRGGLKRRGTRWASTHGWLDDGHRLFAWIFLSTEAAVCLIGPAGAHPKAVETFLILNWDNFMSVDVWIDSVCQLWRQWESCIVFYTDLINIEGNVKLCTTTSIYCRGNIVSSVFTFSILGVNKRTSISDISVDGISKVYDSSMSPSSWITLILLSHSIVLIT